MSGDGAHMDHPGYVSLRDYVDMRLDELDKNVATALHANEVAITKSDAAITYRLESLNEFRQTLSDQNQTYATRAELEAVRNGHAAEIAGLTRQVYIIVGSLAALQAMLQFFG